MTHDESSTCDVVDASLREIMFAKKMFGTANNHVLNSILLKTSVSMFGWHEWSIRLPNVLTFILYFIACVLLAGKLSTNLFMRLFMIIILCTPHYMLDFFSLARGYGMAIAFEMLSFYFSLQFFTGRKPANLLYAFLFAAIAAWANFTWLNVFLALWATLNCVLLVEKKEQSFRQLLIHAAGLNLYPAIIAVLLAVISYKPIGYLSSSDEFKWGSQTWINSFQSFVSSMNYGRSVFFLNADASVSVLKLSLVALFLTAWIFVLLRLLRNYFSKIETFPVYSLITSSMLLTILIAATVMQRYLLDTYYADGRKALFYAPVLLLLLVTMLSWVTTYYQTFGKIASFIVCTGFLIHFVNIFNFRFCNEWWFDKNSKEAYRYIQTDQNKLSKSVAVNWLFMPATKFYNERIYQNAFPVLKKTNEISGFEAFNYVYVIADEIRTVPPIFQPVKRYLWDRFVLVRDSAAYQSAVLAFINTQKATQPAVFTDEEWKTKADSFLLKQRQELNWAEILYSK